MAHGTPRIPLGSRAAYHGRKPRSINWKPRLDVYMDTNSITVFALCPTRGAAFSVRYFPPGCGEIMASGKRVIRALDRVAGHALTT